MGVLPFVSTISTVPSNGDVNPHGVVFIPSMGFKCTTLTSSSILVTNFNNAADIQGTGTTISLLDSSKPGTSTADTFYDSSTYIGLVTLNLLSSGYIRVGNVATNRTTGDVLPGVIQVLDCNANVVATLNSTSGVTHPWGVTVFETVSSVTLFVSNVIEGNVVRLNLPNNPPTFADAQSTIIATGYTTSPSASAFVVGPAGSAYNAASDTLYVAAEGDNQIYAISSASTRTTAVTMGTLVYADQAHLHGPLGLVFTPKGNLLVANADSVSVGGGAPSTITEFTTSGSWVASLSIDQSNRGAFQLAYGSMPSLSVTGVLGR